MCADTPCAHIDTHFLESFIKSSLIEWQSLLLLCTFGQKPYLGLRVNLEIK